MGNQGASRPPVPPSAAQISFPLQQPSVHTLAAFLFPALKALWLCITTLQLGHTPTCDEGMQVQEQELQHVLEGLGQTGIGCAPKCTDSLSLIFQVYQIMGHAYNCASAWAPAILETSP